MISYSVQLFSTQTTLGRTQPRRGLNSVPNSWMVIMNSVSKEYNITHQNTNM